MFNFWKHSQISNNNGANHSIFYDAIICHLPNQNSSRSEDAMRKHEECFDDVMKGSGCVDLSDKTK